MRVLPRWVFRYVGNKTFDFSCKKKDFLPKNDQIWPKTGIFGQFGPGHAGLFSALLVGRLVVVARGLYLARHLFTLLLAKKNHLGTPLFLIKRHNKAPRPGTTPSHGAPPQEQLSSQGSILIAPAPRGATSGKQQKYFQSLILAKFLQKGKQQISLERFKL